MAFAAVVGPSERERIVAASSYYLSPATGLAEVAYMVDPEWQGAGLAGLLHARMFEYARERRVRGFRADVLVGNTRMMRVFQRAGHQLKVKTSAGIEEVTMLFPDYTAEQLLAARGVRAASPAERIAARPRPPWRRAKSQFETSVPDVLGRPRLRRRSEVRGLTGSAARSSRPCVRRRPRAESAALPPGAGQGAQPG